MANVVDRLGGASSSLAFKAPCRLGTTASITLSGYQTIDGTLPTSSEHVDLRRILVKDQTNAEENGIYIMDTGAWERTKDFDGANDFRQGTRIYVFGGSTQSGTYIVSSSMDPSTFDFDTDDITIAEVGTFDQTTSSLGISSGGKISFNSDDVTITHSSSALAFAGAGAGYSFDNGVTLSSALTVSGAAAFNGPVTSTSITVSGGVRIGFSGTPTAGRLEIGDANLNIHAATTDIQRVVFDSNDFLQYDRANDRYQFIVGSSEVARISSNGAITSSGITASGGISLNSSFTSSGNINAVTGTTLTVGGVAGRGILLFGSTTFGIYAGSSAPAIAAGRGSIYLRDDGASSLTRAYIQSSGSTNTWVGLLTTA
jgi:hypothetical protein